MRAARSSAPVARRTPSGAALALAVCCALHVASALDVSTAQAQRSPAAVPPGYQTVPAQPEPPPSYAQGQVAPQIGAPLQAPVAPAPQARRVPVERTETIRALWLPGLIVLPVAWVSTWTAASSAFYGDAVTFSWIPVVGPWLMLTQDLNGHEGGAIVSGVVQGAAALAILLGLTIRRTYVDYEYVIEPAPGARLRLDAISLPGGGMFGASLAL